MVEIYLPNFSNKYALDNDICWQLKQFIYIKIKLFKNVDLNHFRSTNINITCINFFSLLIDL